MNNPPVPYNYDELQRLIRTECPQTATQVDDAMMVAYIHRARQQLMAEFRAQYIANFFTPDAARYFRHPVPSRPKSKPRFSASFRALLQKRRESFHLLPEDDRQELRVRACNPPDCYEPGWVFNTPTKLFKE